MHLSLEVAIGLNTISEGQRIDLKELQNSFNAKWSSLTEKYAEVLEQSRQVLTIAIMSGDAPSGFEERLDTLRTGRQEYIDKTTSRIESILGKELVAQLKLKDTHLNVSLPGGSAVFDRTDRKKSSEAEIELKQSGSGDAVFGRTDGKELSKAEIKELKESAPMQMENKPDEFQTFESTDSTIFGDDTSKLAGGATIPKPIAPSFPERAAKILELGSSEMSLSRLCITNTAKSMMRYIKMLQSTLMQS